MDRDMQQRLTKSVLSEACAIWNDDGAIHAFCEEHNTQLTIDGRFRNAQRVGVLTMVAGVRLDQYNWEVITPPNGDIILLVKGKRAPEPSSTDTPLIKRDFGG